MIFLYSPKLQASLPLYEESLSDKNPVPLIIPLILSNSSFPKAIWSSSRGKLFAFQLIPSPFITIFKFPLFNKLLDRESLVIFALLSFRFESSLSVISVGTGELLDL